MKRHPVLVGGAVALICAAILVLFTDLEVKVVGWVNCGPIGGQREGHSQACR